MSEEIVLDQEQIKELIPHRDPFLFVDKVIELVPGEKIVGIREITGDEDFFKGHFPGNPVTPGVVIMEALAQTGGILVKLSDEATRDKLFYLVGANNCKWRRPVLPGDTVRLEVGDIKRKRNVWTLNGAAYVGDNLVCKGTITAASGD